MKFKKHQQVQTTTGLRGEYEGSLSPSGHIIRVKGKLVAVGAKELRHVIVKLKTITYTTSISLDCYDKSIAGVLKAVKTVDRETRQWIDEEILDEMEYSPEEFDDDGGCRVISIKYLGLGLSEDADCPEPFDMVARFRVKAIVPASMARFGRGNDTAHYKLTLSKLSK
jgi:hypothetical protein